MFRDMRRFKQLLPNDEAVKLLEENTSGVLALLGDEDYPYAVPLSYVYSDNKIYFHCAKTGHKVDAVKKCDKASFCIIAQDQVVEEKYTTYFKSVIAFGRVKLLTTADEMLEPISLLAAKYAPNDPDGRQKEIEREFDRMYMIELDIEHLTGKQCIELCK